jgi:DNA replication protein DnaC
MLNHPTIDKLHALRLNGMAAALAQQQNNPDIEALGFEERLGLLVEREASERESRQTSSRLRRARLKFSDAVAEDIDYRKQPVKAPCLARAESIERVRKVSIDEAATRRCQRRDVLAGA